MLLTRVETRKCVLERDGIRVVSFCGGSGAELLAFALSYNHSSLKEMHITVVDKEPLWRSTSLPTLPFTRSLSSLFSSLQSYVSFSLTYSFVVADLFAPSSLSALLPLLRSADICTMVYGFSELLDSFPEETLLMLHGLRDFLPEGCLFMVVDPLSHQFCCEKEMEVKMAMMSCEGERDKRKRCAEWGVLYEGHDKVSVTRSVIEPFIGKMCATLNMQMNRDIKLSCHTWCVVMKKGEGCVRSVSLPLPSSSRSSSLPLSPSSLPLSPSPLTSTPSPLTSTPSPLTSTPSPLTSTPSPLTTTLTATLTTTPTTTLILTQLPCIEDITRTLRSTLHTNLWLPRDCADDANRALYARLTSAWQRYGGVLVLPYTVFQQVQSQLPSLTCSLVVLHNYDCFVETEENEWTHSLLHAVKCQELVITLQRAEVTALLESIQALCSNCRVAIKSKTADMVMEHKSVVEEVREWKPTEAQSSLLSVCSNNNLRTLVMIHPALIHDKKLVSGKQYDGNVGLVKEIQCRRCKRCETFIPTMPSIRHSVSAYSQFSHVRPRYSALSALESKKRRGIGKWQSPFVCFLR